MCCKKCGGKLESYANNCAFCGAQVEKYDANVSYVKPQDNQAEYKPMTTIKWIGLFILPGIPLIGTFAYLVLMFKWAFGDTKDLTLKGFARANLLAMALAIILIILLSILVLPTLLEMLKQLSAQG